MLFRSSEVAGTKRQFGPTSAYGTMHTGIILTTTAGQAVTCAGKDEGAGTLTTTNGYLFLLQIDP